MLSVIDLNGAFFKMSVLTSGLSSLPQPVAATIITNGSQRTALWQKFMRQK
jgi:hypothetical protein